MRPGRAGALLSAFLTVATPLAHAAPPRVLAGYSVTSWTDADGLPFGAVFSIVQDSDGYLWVGTNAGLLRFDGVRFTPWAAIGTDPLPNSPVSALAMGADGALFVGLTNDGGVYRLRGQHADALGPARPLHGAVTTLLQDGQGTLWAVADNALFRLADSKWNAMTVTGAPLADGRMTSLSLTANKVLLVGSTKGLFRHVPERGAFEQLTDGWIWSASEDPAGKLWVTDTLAGFRPIDRKASATSGFERNGFRLQHDRVGNLWVATIGEGLWRVRSSGGTDQVEKAALSTGLFSDSVQSLFEDREGNMWAGTTVGLHRLARQKLTPLPNIGLVITADAGTDDGIWVGTNYGLARFRQTDSEWQGERAPGPRFYVRSMHRDRSGTLWVGANEGLYRLSGNEAHAVGLPAPLSGVPIASIASNGHDLWLGDGRRLFRWTGGRVLPFQPPPAAAGRDISFAYVDRHDRLWLAFHDGSVGALDGKGSFQAFQANAFGAAKTIVYSITEDATHDMVWLATSSGISRIVDGHVDRLPDGHGVPGNRVWSIAQDPSGSLWANVDVGVVRFGRADFDRAIRDARPLHYELFDPSDGLAGAPILNVRSGQSANGQLWFVRGGALSIVDPAAIATWPTPEPGTVRIEDARNEERTVRVLEREVFPAGTRRIEIDYTALALSFPNRIQFRYRLDGFDTQWIEAGTRRTASYTNLPPRSYTFHVNASTADGAWRAAEAQWTFAIEPRFFQTRWFYLLAAGTLTLCIAAAWQLRVRLVRREYAMVLAERTRMSREIHDTLLQSLVGLAMQLDNLGHSLADGPVANARSTVLRMRRNVEAYIREARQSIWNLRSPLLETQDLPGALRELGRRGTAGSSVAFTLALRGDPRRYSPRIENELLRIAQEAITNAMRHAHASRIDLLLEFGGSHVTLDVADDGRGLLGELISEAHTHYGIVSMRERAESLGGRLTVGRSTTGGTQVEAVLPIATAA